MTILKTKIKRKVRQNSTWSTDDWASRLPEQKNFKASSDSLNTSSNIVLKASSDSIAMIKTKHFLSESLKSRKGMEGTIIFGTTFIENVPYLHEILLNIQPLGWVYIPGGRKDEKQ